MTVTTLFAVKLLLTLAVLLLLFHILTRPDSQRRRDRRDARQAARRTRRFHHVPDEWTRERR